MSPVLVFREVPYLQNITEQQTKDEASTSAAREPPAAGRCVGCPYPSTGFMCWCDRKCLRTEMARIIERDKKSRKVNARRKKT